MLLPLEKIWAKAYTNAHPGSRIQVLATGSGVGLSESGRGEVAIGASDFYLTREIRQHHPNLVSIPVAISDAEVVYNLPGFSNKIPVQFDGPVLARIYLGEIRTWEDPALRRLNPDLPLPHRTIHVVHRSDASGTTLCLHRLSLPDIPSMGESDRSGGRSPQWTSERHTPATRCRRSFWRGTKLHGNPGGIDAGPEDRHAGPGTGPITALLRRSVGDPVPPVFRKR